MKTFAFTFIRIVAVCAFLIAEVFLLLAPAAIGLSLAGAVGGVVGLVIGLALAGATVSAAYERWS